MCAANNLILSNKNSESTVVSTKPRLQEYHRDHCVHKVFYDKGISSFQGQKAEMRDMAVVAAVKLLTGLKESNDTNIYTRATIIALWICWRHFNFG